MQVQRVISLVRDITKLNGFSMVYTLLKTDIHVNFIVTDGTTGYHDDNLRIIASLTAVQTLTTNLAWWQFSIFSGKYNGPSDPVLG